MIYELICLISSKIDEKQKAVLIDQIVDLIIDFQGKVLEKKDLGEKQLAYLIKNEKVANSLIVYFELDTERVEEFEKKLKTFNQILRWQIFKSKGLISQKPEKEEKKLEKKKDTSGQEKEERLEHKDILDI